MTWPPSLKCFSLRKPLTRARIVTSSRARVVPIGLTTTGSVLFCAATTTTRGGTGSGLGPAVTLQPGLPSTTAAAEAHRARSRAANGGERSGCNVMGECLRVKKRSPKMLEQVQWSASQIDQVFRVLES